MTDLEARAEQLLTAGYSDGDGLRDIPPDAQAIIRELLSELRSRQEQIDQTAANLNRANDDFEFARHEMEAEVASLRAERDRLNGVAAERMKGWNEATRAAQAAEASVASLVEALKVARDYVIAHDFQGAHLTQVDDALAGVTGPPAQEQP